MAGVLTMNLVLQKSKVDDISRIRTLNVCSAQLSDIGVLRQAYNLQVLSLSLNEISEIGAISNCHRLTELYLRRNHIRDINQVLHLTRLEYLEVLSLSDNPISRDGNYRRFVIAAIPSLARLDDVDISDEERDEALRIFPRLTHFAPPASPYAAPIDGITPPPAQQQPLPQQQQAKPRRASASRAPPPPPQQKPHQASMEDSGRRRSPPAPTAQNRRAAAPSPMHKDPRPQQAPRQQAPPPQQRAAPPPQRERGYSNVQMGPSEEGVVQAVKVLCSELSPEALDEIRRFVDSMAGY